MSLKDETQRIASESSASSDRRVFFPAEAAVVAHVASDSFVDTIPIPTYHDTRPIPIIRLAAIDPASRIVSRPQDPPNHEGLRAVPRSENRRSESIALRLVVALLFLTALTASGASVALHKHPAWFSSLRNIAYANVAPHMIQNQPLSNRATLVMNSSTVVTYRVPSESYAITVTFGHPCWIVVKSPANSSSPFVARTYLPASSPVVIPVRGSASITIAARVRSITVGSGSTAFENIPSPLLGVAYTFVQ